MLFFCEGNDDCGVSFDQTMMVYYVEIKFDTNINLAAYSLLRMFS